MQHISTRVWQTAAVRLGLNAFIFLKFSIAALYFCFTCSSKVRQESRCSLRYLIKLVCCMGVVPKLRCNVSACVSFGLEPNIMNSVFSLLSFSRINVVHLANLFKVFSMLFFVLFLAVRHFAGKDIFILWSFAKPDISMDDGMESMMSEQ